MINQFFSFTLPHQKNKKTIQNIIQITNKNTIQKQTTKVTQKMNIKKPLRKKMLADNIFTLKLAELLNCSQANVCNMIRNNSTKLRLWEIVQFIKSYYQLTEEAIFETENLSESLKKIISETTLKNHHHENENCPQNV